MDTYQNKSVDKRVLHEFAVNLSVNFGFAYLMAGSFLLSCLLVFKSTNEYWVYPTIFAIASLAASGLNLFLGISSLYRFVMILNGHELKVNEPEDEVDASLTEFFTENEPTY